MPHFKKTNNGSYPASEQTASLDRELVQLLIRRSRLLGKAAADRRDRKLALVDAGQERRLWEEWLQTLKGQAPVTRTWRLLFDLANELAYGFEGPGKEETAMLLEPSRAPVRIRSAAPPDLEETRLWVAVAAMAPSPFRVEPVVFNDFLFELMKSLNQLNAGISWDNSGVESTTAVADRSGGVVFAGDDRLNLYILTCLCASATGTTKFSGGPALKTADLRIMRDILVQAGARTSFLTPRGYGLPLRLEASGVVQDDIVLGPDAPRELGMALVLTAPLFSNGLTLRWEEVWSGASGMQKAASILRACGIGIEAGPHSLQIEPGVFKLPSRLETNLDCILAASLLSLAQITGGQVELSGRWPTGMPQAEACTALLENFGARLSIKDNTIAARPGSAQDGVDLDVRECPELMPLAVAFALLLPQGARILIDETVAVIDHAVEFLEGLNQPCTVQKGEIRVGPPMPLQQGGAKLTPPDALWCIAGAMVAFRFLGIEITNPGNMASLWPQFWSVYRRLPSPGDLMAKREPRSEKPDFPKEKPDVKKRKRYLVK